MANNDTAVPDSALNIAERQNGLLIFMFERSPRISLYPAPPGAIKEVAEVVGMEAGQKSPTNFYVPMIQLFDLLIKLGFIELTVKAESQGDRELQVHARTLHSGDLEGRFEETANSHRFASLLKKIGERNGINDAEPELHPSPRAREVGGVEDLFIAQIFYSLTPKGYEVAMSLVAHKDGAEVRRATVAASKAAQKSAKMAGYALHAAIAIAFGSVGNLISNLPGRPWPLLIYIVVCGFAVAWMLKKYCLRADNTD